MLPEIEELAQTYIPEEPHKLTKEHKYTRFAVCLFKIISCSVFVLDDLNTFISFQLTECRKDTESKLSKNNRFIATCIVIKDYSLKKLANMSVYELDDSKVKLQFCKIRKCTEQYYDSTTDYFYENMYNHIDVCLE